MITLELPKVKYFTPNRSNVLVILSDTKLYFNNGYLIAFSDKVLTNDQLIIVHNYLAGSSMGYALNHLDRDKSKRINLDTFKEKFDELRKVRGL